MHWLSNCNSKGLSGCGRYNNEPFTHSIASVVAHALGMHLLQVRFTSSLLASITPELDDATTLHGCGHPSLLYCTGGRSHSYSRTVTPVLYGWLLPYGMLLLLYCHSHTVLVITPIVTPVLSLPYCTGDHSHSYSRTVTPILYWWSLPYGMVLLPYGMVLLPYGMLLLPYCQSRTGCGHSFSARFNRYHKLSLTLHLYNLRCWFHILHCSAY